MIGTYTVYCFILFGGVFFAYLYEKSRPNSKRSKFWYFLAFFIPFIFLAIRYDIGIDYPSYIQYYHWIIDGENIRKEPAYLLINHAIGYFNLETQWLFVFFGFFSMFFSYKALPKEGFYIAVFLFISIFYLYEGYTIIRQGLAVAIMAYATKYIYQKNFKVYLIFAILASMFHLMTGVLLVALYPFVNFNFNNKIMISSIIILFLLGQIYEFGTILINMVGYFMPKYAWYAGSEFSGKARTSYGLLGPIIKLSLVITVLLAKDKMIKKYPISNIYINYYYLYGLIYIFHLQIIILGRVERIFIFSVILATTYYLLTLKKNIRPIIVSIVLGFYFIMFIRYITIGTMEIDNDIHVSPYQTIFDR